MSRQDGACPTPGLLTRKAYAFPAAARTSCCDRFGRTSDAAELIAELDADLAVRYGSDDDPVLAHPEEFESPVGRFFVVTDGWHATRLRRHPADRPRHGRAQADVRPTGGPRPRPGPVLLAACEEAPPTWASTSSGSRPVTRSRRPSRSTFRLATSPYPAFGQYQHSPRSITLGKPLPATRCDSGVGGVV